MPEIAKIEPEPPDEGRPPSASAEPRTRVLALDVGDRRIGLAMSDPLGYTAQPLFTLHRTGLRADLKSIARVLRKHAVSDVVVGLALHASGEVSPQATKTRAFAEALGAQNPMLRVHFVDERYTTAEAHELLDHSQRRARSKADRQARSAMIDQVAAVLLLEAFLSLSSPRLLPPPPDR